MIYGWAGTDLEIDLSKGNIEKKAFDGKLYENHLGGKGNSTKIMWDRVPPEVDPFSSDNLLIFGAGVLTGTMVPGANRGVVTFKSPVTDFLASSAIGGHFAPELKHAGYNTIVIRKKSPAPVYLWINNDTVEIRDAGHLWGKDTMETQEEIREETDERAQILCIGQAGENKVYSASIEHGLGVSASRRGSGTVMGDKNLKAIAVRGTKDVYIAEPSRLNELCEQILNRIGPWQERWAANPAYEFDLHLPDGAYGNFRDTVPPEIEKVIMNRKELGKEFETTAPLVRRMSCYNCSLQCRRMYLCADGRYAGLKCATYIAPVMTAQIFEGSFAVEFYNLCEKYGLDYYGPANLISLAIDLYEKGILTKEDTDGMHLEFGNADVALSLIKKIAFREGIGDILADGVYRAVRRIGKGAEEYGITTKKLETRNEFRFYDMSYALGGAVYDHIDTDRTGDLLPCSATMSREEREEFLKSEFWGHNKEMEEYFLNGWDENGINLETRVQTMSYAEEYWNLVDDLGLCAWWAGRFSIPPPITGPAMFADLLSYTTGINIDETELMGIAKRNVNLIRGYNVREGLRRKDETAPEFYFHKKPPAHISIPAYSHDSHDSDKGLSPSEFGGVSGVGAIAQHTIPKPLDRDLFNKHIDRWYEVKGWDSDGIPTKETLSESGLDYVGQDLEDRDIMSTKT